MFDLYNREITADTNVLVLGFPDPLMPNCIDFAERMTVRDSMINMKKHLEELDIGVKKYYQFSVLLVGEEGRHKLLYTLWGDGEVSLENGYEDIEKYIDKAT